MFWCTTLLNFLSLPISISKLPFIILFPFLIPFLIGLLGCFGCEQRKFFRRNLEKSYWYHIQLWTLEVALQLDNIQQDVSVHNISNLFVIIKFNFKTHACLLFSLQEYMDLAWVLGVSLICLPIYYDFRSKLFVKPLVIYIHVLLRYKPCCIFMHYCIFVWTKFHASSGKDLFLILANWIFICFWIFAV